MANPSERHDELNSAVDLAETTINKSLETLEVSDQEAILIMVKIVLRVVERWYVMGSVVEGAAYFARLLVSRAAEQEYRDRH